MKHETPYPEPRIPEPLTEITEEFHATTWVQNLIIVCSNDVIYIRKFPESFVQIKKVVRKKK